MAFRTFRRGDGRWVVTRDDLPSPLYLASFETKANARAYIQWRHLNDAAPDLLAALKAVRTRGLPNRYNSDRELAEQVDAAIAKAEGCEP